jgi:acyl-CoA dehydrogenase
MPKLVSGEIHGCFGLTEPDAGSDSFMMRTSALRDGDHWVINGSKQWTSWSPTAKFITVFAVTNKEQLAARKGGITCFYIPAGHPGFRLESVLKIFGAIGGDEAILSFTDVRIPDEWRLGEVDRGFVLAMMGVKHGRIANAGRTLGLARWAMDKAMAYSKIRRTFGKTLSEHQTIQNYLAENAIKLYAGRAMSLDCAERVDRGEDVRGEISMLKVFTTRAAHEVIDKCIQIHGGMGIANETHLYDALNTARVTQLGEGPNEIQLRSIARLLLDDRIDLSFP